MIIVFLIYKSKHTSKLNKFCSVKFCNKSKFLCLLYAFLLLFYFSQNIKIHFYTLQQGIELLIISDLSALV